MSGASSGAVSWSEGRRDLGLWDLGGRLGRHGVNHTSRPAEQRQPLIRGLEDSRYAAVTLGNRAARRGRGAGRRSVYVTSRASARRPVRRAPVRPVPKAAPAWPACRSRTSASTRPGAARFARRGERPRGRTTSRPTSGVVELLASLAAAGDLVALPQLAELGAGGLERRDQLLEGRIADVPGAVGAELRHEQAGAGRPVARAQLAPRGVHEPQPTRGCATAVPARAPSRIRARTTVFQAR